MLRTTRASIAAGIFPCILALAACRDQGPTAPEPDSGPPLAARGLFNGPGLRGTIAFQSNRAGNEDLYETELGSGFVRQLTTSTARDVDPSWWDRGRGLLFTTDRDGSVEVYSLEVESGAVTRLTFSDASIDGSCGCSTSGTGRAASAHCGERWS